MKEHKAWTKITLGTGNFANIGFNFHFPPTLLPQVAFLFHIPYTSCLHSSQLPILTAILLFFLTHYFPYLYALPFTSSLSLTLCLTIPSYSFPTFTHPTTYQLIKFPFTSSPIILHLLWNTTLLHYLHPFLFLHDEIKLLTKNYPVIILTSLNIHSSNFAVPYVSSVYLSPYGPF